jgi:hypothetical protein
MRFISSITAQRALAGKPTAPIFLKVSYGMSTRGRGRESVGLLPLMERERAIETETEREREREGERDSNRHTERKRERKR